MKVLLDVVHPAHVHFYRYMRTELEAEGHQVRMVSREKDITTELLDRLAIPHRSVGKAGGGGLVSAGLELVRRVWSLHREIRSFDADIVLTRNPAGVQAAKLARVLGVFDTDDGSEAGLHFHAARPFADVITTPACSREDYGARHRRYKGFKALAYLHPDRFRPDPQIRSDLGIGSDEPLFVVRFSAYQASHDRGAQGLDMDERQAIVRELSSRGRLVISDEAPLPEHFRPFRITVPPDRFHDLLAAADLCVGDSQSVAAEAAILGTPALRLSSFGTRLDTLRVLEEEYGLIENFSPGQSTQLLRRVKEVANRSRPYKERMADQHKKMLSQVEDVTSWYVRLVKDLYQKRELSE